MSAEGEHPGVVLGQSFYLHALPTRYLPVPVPPSRSFWTGIQIIKLDASTGKPAVGAAITNLASRDDPGDNGAIEGAFLVPRLGSWWLFVSWNHCCEGNKVSGWMGVC